VPTSPPLSMDDLVSAAGSLTAYNTNQHSLADRRHTPAETDHLILHAPFTGESTQQHDFRALQGERRQPAAHPDHLAVHTLFEGETTYHHDFNAATEDASYRPGMTRADLAGHRDYTNVAATPVQRVRFRV